MTSKVRKANRLEADDIARFLDADAALAPSFTLQVCHSRQLSEDDKVQIFDLFSSNMQGIYGRSSFGWDPVSKRSELFHSTSRFIIIRHAPSETSTVVGTSAIVAYTMFRFDREEKQNIIYCYELQVSSSVQRNQLGQQLMRHLGCIAQATGMSKIMLTVQNVNTAAIRFYERIGFTIDPTSPDHELQGGDDEWVNDSEEDDETEYDYRILSKEVSTAM